VLATRKQAWGEDRVMFHDADGRLCSLLAAWTDVDAPSEFALAAGGRACLRPDLLVELRMLIDAMEAAYERG